MIFLELIFSNLSHNVDKFTLGKPNIWGFFEKNVSLITNNADLVSIVSISSFKAGFRKMSQKNFIVDSDWWFLWSQFLNFFSLLISKSKFLYFIFNKSLISKTLSFMLKCLYLKSEINKPNDPPMSVDPITETLLFLKTGTW